MGLGNGNPNQGNKGSNFSYEKSVLQLLGRLPISGPKTPAITESLTDGDTPINIHAFSIVFRGTGGTLGGVAVPDNYTANFGNGIDLLTTVIAYQVPTAGEARVIITTLS